MTLVIKTKKKHANNLKNEVTPARVVPARVVPAQVASA